MTRQERLKFCKICVNQKFDLKQGIICGLTDAPATFENECPDFLEDIEKMKKEKESSLQKELLDSAVPSKTRLFNFILDSVFLYITALIVGFVGGFLYFQFNPEVAYEVSEPNVLIDYMLGILIAGIYYFGFELAFSRTPGKFITGTKVVDEKGSKPEPGKLMLRTLSRFVPFEPFSFLGSDNRGWHDKWSDTRVIKAK
jgi:uncharacterized RDD family membrane protein YckC